MASVWLLDQRSHPKVSGLLLEDGFYRLKDRLVNYTYKSEKDLYKTKRKIGKVM